MTDLRWVRFEWAGLGESAFEVKGLLGEEELNRLFSFTVQLVIPDLAASRGIPLDLLVYPEYLGRQDTQTLQDLVVDIDVLTHISRQGCSRIMI